MSEDPAAVAGAGIRKAREDQGLSIRDLAEKAGVAPGTVHLIETGQRDPAVGTLAKIAYALDIDPGDLFPSSPLATPDPEARPGSQSFELFMESIREGLRVFRYTGGEAPADIEAGLRSFSADIFSIITRAMSVEDLVGLLGTVSTDFPRKRWTLLVQTIRYKLAERGYRQAQEALEAEEQGLEVEEPSPTTNYLLIPEDTIDRVIQKIEAGEQTARGAYQELVNAAWEPGG